LIFEVNGVIGIHFATFETSLNSDLFLPDKVGKVKVEDLACYAPIVGFFFASS